MIKAETALEESRIRINSQYPSCPQRFHTTNAASKNDDKNGPINTTQRQKMPTLRKLVKRIDPPIAKRVRPAPISASVALLINQQTIIRGGTSPCNCAAKCAGNAAASTNHHKRIGVSKSAATTIEFGGQRTDTGCGCNVSAKPTLQPR